VAHQLIFTSSVRGIKPGASGYCTVLRSPGIRPSIERALEGLSVFEHIARNVGGSVQSLRHIELRGVTYYVLSRVSDAGKDYTGRTNFLAHYLVFEANELPAVSPVDLLLNWAGWCHTWSGEPREEAVDASSFSSVARIQAPATLWQQQSCGVSPAARLAAGADMKVLIQSLSLSSAELLQLVGEAFAIRAQLGQDASANWKTSFAVGLASDSHAKDFTWIGAYWEAASALLRQREVIDVAATQVNAAAVDAKALAIATTGRYVEPPKPIQLTQDLAIRGVLDQALHEQASVASNHTRGARNPVIRRQSSKGGGAKPSKKRSKLPIYMGLSIALLTVVYLGGKEPYYKFKYVRALKEMKVFITYANEELDRQKSWEHIEELAKFNLTAQSDDRDDYEKLNQVWTDSLLNSDSYQKAFEELRKYGGYSDESVASAPALKSEDENKGLSEEIAEGPKVDSATSSVMGIGYSADEPLVNDPGEVFNSSPAALPKEEFIFAIQDLKVYFSSVGKSFPKSANKLVKSSEVFVMRDFLSKHTPLTESDFVEKASYIPHNRVLILKGDQPIIIVNKNNQFDSSAKGIAVLTKTDYGGHELFLVYPERGSYCLKSEFELKSPFSAKKTLDHFKGIFDLTAFGGKHELILYNGDKKCLQPEGDPSAVSPFRRKMVEAAIKEYKLTEKEVSMDLVERAVINEVAEIIKKHIEALKMPDEKDVSLAISKLQELIKLLKDERGAIQNLSVRMKGLGDDVESSADLAASDSDRNKERKAESELIYIRSKISNQMKETRGFALTRDLERVTYWDSEGSDWKEKSWQELSKEIERYVAYNSEESKREQQKKERDAFSEDKLKFSELEVRGDQRPIAKFNLKYSE
jgi:hypothetical protein